MNESTASKYRNWRYKGAGIFVLFHFFALILICTLPYNELAMLESPMLLLAMGISMIAPSLMDAIIRMFPHPSALRGALNPGTFIVSTLLWALMGYAGGRFAERLMKSELPKTHA